MAIALQQPNTLTYERYVADGETEGLCEIIDGVRYHMTGPNRMHQDVAANIFEQLRAYQRVAKNGRAYHAPTDVLIARSPLRVRQPDVLYISARRLALCEPPELYNPIVRPELIVEVLSPSDHRTAIASKLTDYARIETEECWLVSHEARTVQVLALENSEYRTVKIYGDSDVIHSVILDDLAVEIDDIFAD